MSDWWHADPVTPAKAGGDWWHADPVTEQPSVAKDVLKSGGIGVAKGAIGLAGLPGDLASLVQHGIEGHNPFDWLAQKYEAAYPEQAAANRALAEKVGRGKDFGGMPTSRDIQSSVEGVTGKFYEPQTTPGKYAQTVGEFAPAAAMGPGGVIRKAIGGAVAPGLASEAAGQASEGKPYEPYARLGGAVAGGLGASAASRAVTPLPFRGSPASAAEHANAVATLEHEGVPLTAGQRTDRARLKYLENDLSPELNSRQAEAFTSAALRRVGLDETHATIGPQGNVTGALNRIGGDFDRLQAANTLHVDAPLVQDLLNTHDAYTRVPGLFNDETINTVRGVMQRIGSVARSPTAHTMTGQEYQTLTSDLRRAGRGAADPQRAEAINEIVGHLDDAMERSIARTNPQDIGAWQQARRDYRNILVIERAATANGQGAARGYISPAQLASATKAVYGRRSYMRGVDDFSELAQAGNAVMKPLPDSGTSQRARIDQYIAHAVRGAGGLGGMALGGGHAMEGGVGGLLAGELVTPLLEPVVRSGLRGAVMNPATQNYLANQLMAGPNQALNIPMAERLARALMQNAPQLSGHRLPRVTQERE